jgi:proline iminopeptidase
VAPRPRTARHRPHEERVRISGADLYVRQIGAGPPIIVLHGGPDFDHRYLLPDMDRLADAYRLIYYDQRGRGLSASGVNPEDVTLRSEIEDLDGLRRHLGLGNVTLLGHSFGTLIALEYAIRHPDRVSRLILMNPVPASHTDFKLFREERVRRWPSEMEERSALGATAGYKDGDPDAVAAYYRPHFRPALARRAHLERVLAALRASFTRDGILKARAIEDRLMEETWLVESYDLFPQLARLAIPTLVLFGDREIIPEACATNIARAIPHASYVVFKNCGHFPYLESPDRTRRAIDKHLR